MRIAILLVLCGWLSVAAAQEPLVVDVGSAAYRDRAGYGWSNPEHVIGGVRCWMVRREADLDISLGRPMDRVLRLRVAPCLRLDQNQNLGLYLNGRFVADWVFERSPEMTWFTCRIPAQRFRAGRNRLTFRCGYLLRPHGESRTLGVLFDKLEFSVASP